MDKNNNINDDKLKLSIFDYGFRPKIDFNKDVIHNKNSMMFVLRRNEKAHHAYDMHFFFLLSNC